MKIEPIKRGQSLDERGIAQVVCIRITDKLLEKVDDLAERNDVTRSSVIIHAIEQLISRSKK